MPKRLHIFTPVWGDYFTNLLDRALGQSFQWSTNARAVENCIWTLFTTTGEKAKIAELAQRIIPTATIRILTNDRLLERNAEIGALKMRALLISIKQCLDENCTMLMSTPDFIWANGSLHNMIAESYPDESQGLCVSIAHMRVLPSILEPILSNGYRERGSGSDETVDHAFDHQHESWIRSEIQTWTTPKANGIYHSGVAWRRASGGLITVQHQMPSPFVVNFRESDLKEFERWKGVTPPAFGEWDHNWPSKLIEEGRLRYIGSSDVAFMVEVTEADKNVPPLTDARTPHDQFFRDEPSVKIQKQFISTFRY
jgi:hypothetical protein